MGFYRFLKLWKKDITMSKREDKEINKKSILKNSSINIYGNYFFNINLINSNYFSIIPTNKREISRKYKIAFLRKIQKKLF